MKKMNCPSCGAEVVFQANVSVYAICTFCQSMIVRHDIDVDSIGIMATLPDDMSPFMLGTEGNYQGVHFRLIGRLKIGWEDGTWNEWFMLSENGGKGWLSEAQGFYAVCFEYVDALSGDAQKAIDKLLGLVNKKADNNRNAYSKFKSIRNSLLGTSLFLDQLKYKIVDIKTTVCLGSEGELPFIAPKGRKTMAIDLLGYHGEFGSIEIAVDKVRIYLGHYKAWDDLRFQRVRPLEGW